MAGRPHRQKAKNDARQQLWSPSNAWEFELSQTSPRTIITIQQFWHWILGNTVSSSLVVCCLLFAWDGRDSPAQGQTHLRQYPISVWLLCWWPWSTEQTGMPHTPALLHQRPVVRVILFVNSWGKRSPSPAYRIHCYWWSALAPLILASSINQFESMNSNPKMS